MVEKKWKFDSKSAAIGFMIGMFFVISLIIFVSPKTKGEKLLQIENNLVFIEWSKSEFSKKMDYRYLIKTESEIIDIKDSKGDYSFSSGNDYIKFYFEGKLTEVTLEKIDHIHQPIIKYDGKKLMEEKKFISSSRKEINILIEDIIIEAKRLFEKYSAYKSYVE